MKIWKEYDHSRAACPTCGKVVSTTFFYRSYNAPGTRISLHNILQGYCDVCGDTVSLPHQSAIKIGELLKITHKKIKKSAEGKDLKKDCSNYDENKYRNPAITVDIAILCRMQLKEGSGEEGLKVLLIKRKHNPFKNCRAIPGGFVEIAKNETLEEAAYRELREETSLSKKELKDSVLRQSKTYGDPGRDPRTRVISVLFYAIVPYSEKLLNSVKARDDAKEAGWFDLYKLPKKMAFDHAKMLEELRMKRYWKS